MVLLARIELATPPLPRVCSTTEPQQQLLNIGNCHILPSAARVCCMFFCYTIEWKIVLEFIKYSNTPYEPKKN